MDIRISGVAKVFPPDIVALEDIYLTVSRGEFVYLVGTTGSGKTTLLRLITREVEASRGHITVGDFSLRKMRSLDLAFYRRDVGVVFQDFKLLSHLTVMENVAFVLEVLGMPPREIRERVGEVLERVGIWRRRFLYPEQLSGGEKQRVAIARAIVNTPSIVLADEPTGNLDMHTAEDVMQLLLSVNASGTTVIMATHNEHIVEAYHHRVVELRGGRMISDKKRRRCQEYEAF